MPNLRDKTWTTTTPASVTDAQFWEDHLLSDNGALKTVGTLTIKDSENNILGTFNGSADKSVTVGTGSGGGHTIKDADGNEMAQETVLKFLNAEVTDTNNETVVDCKGQKGDKGDKGDTGSSLNATHTKAGAVTTVNITNADTGEVIDTFTVTDGTDSGNMNTSDYAQLGISNTVDQAAKLYDSDNNKYADTEVLAKLSDDNGVLKYNNSAIGEGDMTKSEFATNGNEGIVDKASLLVDTVNNKTADTAVLAKFSYSQGLKYDGIALGMGDMRKSVYASNGETGKVDYAIQASVATTANSASNLKKTDGTLVDANTITTKILNLDSDGKIDYSNVKNTPNLSNKIDKPSTASAGQVLTYRNSQWVAEDSQGGSITEPTELEKGVIGGDAYVSGQTYQANETCIYNNKIYVCKATTTELPSNTNYWKETSISALNSNIMNLFTLDVANAIDITSQVFNGNTYTAPSNGLLVIGVRYSSENIDVNVVSGSGMQMLKIFQSFTNKNNFDNTFVGKGTIIKFTLQTKSVPIDCKFIPYKL